MKEILVIKDVETFFQQLLADGLNFHPDEDFTNYINTDTRKPTYTESEAEERNVLMDKCFDVCERDKVDIYDLAQKIFLRGTGLDKYIPLPSKIEKL